jgi:Ca2+-binding EF-hand superfamily protein
VGIICAQEVEVKELFEKFDYDNSGTLELNEFRAMIKCIVPAYEVDMIDVVFNMIDTNKDGAITKK